jgi:hypothetical protein
MYHLQELPIPVRCARLNASLSVETQSWIDLKPSHITSRSYRYP